jgi:tetratricopeptide (TPR) repeat protein
MTNPHPQPCAPLLALPVTPQHRTQSHRTRLGLRCLALGLALIGMSVGTSQAQSINTFDWQPGQSSLPTVISTPHNNVRNLLRQAKYPQALLLVNQALVTRPNDPQMRFWQGFIFEQLDKPEMALQVYQSLTQEYPELAEPHNNLGVLYAAKGDYPSAKASLDAALRANPNYPDALENMGDLLVNMARQSYERALTLEPKKRDVTQKIERLQPLLNMTQGKP